MNGIEQIGLSLSVTAANAVDAWGKAQFRKRYVAEILDYYFLKYAHQRKYTKIIAVLKEKM